MGLQYYTLDCETTGLSTKTHEVVEVSIIRNSDRVQITKFIKAEYPENASYDALRITNKTLADLQKGSSKEEAVKEMNKFFAEDEQGPGARCIVAHNAAFDRKFMHILWEKCNMEFPAHIWLDSISLTQEFIKISDISTLNITKTATGKISKTLHAACDLVGIKKLSEAHASKVDSRNTYLLWKRLTEEKGIDHLPFHKTFVHTIKKSDQYEDINDLDLSDIL